ncbi:winged helix-turn-helix transcriptional regulator [Streptococcus mutans]|uniref:winged helix-turn-helix transcriptional regulator n=1 Tax=Streptococcus mutans TaxID=1309 RepID=UPI0002B55C1F|nr:helix-turn-helix domain-containing protein [Streptococcus mutans]EMC49320.1 hypothetical protein SMU104_08240 [Streptococcus mutans SA41]
MQTDVNKERMCPVAKTLSLIGGKWKGLLIYRLIDGKKRFNELQRMNPRISHRSLTLQLRELEASGLIKRTVYPVIPPKVEYELTELGQSMKPIIIAMYQWGRDYQDKESEGTASAKQTW